MAQEHADDKAREAYGKARRLIEEARRTGAPALSLSGLGLTLLPPQIGALTALKGLDLSFNQLSCLPPEIGSLTALQTLYLHNNLLSSLPPEIRRLKKLERLFLHRNPALNLPPEVLGPSVLTAHSTKKAKLAHPAAILNYYFRTRG